LGRDQPGLRTGIEATAGASRHGYAAENIAFATKGGSNMSAQGIALVVLHISSSMGRTMWRSDGPMDGPRVAKRVKDGLRWRFPGYWTR